MSGDARHADHEALRDDLAAFALGALPEEEATELEQHLAGCEGCRERLRWLTPAVDVLPASIEQRTPPPRLRENLMATVRAEAIVPEPTAAPTRPVREPWWRNLGGFVLRPAVGIAALVVLVIGIGAGYAIRGDGTEPAESTFTKAEPANVALASEISATLEREGDSATLHVHSMPRLHRDEVYEVWVQRADVMEPTSVFVLRNDGTAEAAIPGPLEGGEAIYVTREPRGGSQKPTTDPLLSAPL